jgi:hypothetical protein
MPASVRGQVATIRWSYYEAAKIDGYTISRQDTDWRVVATVIQANAYNLSRSPLVFAAHYAGGVWTWPILEYTLNNGRLHARLGPPQERIP